MEQQIFLENYYCQLSDNELINKLTNEKKELTDEVLYIISAELSKRMVNIKEIENKLQEEENYIFEYENYKKTKNSDEIEFDIDYILNSKNQKITEKEIFDYLENKKYSKGIIFGLYKDAKIKLQDLIDSIWQNIFYGFVAFSVGLFVIIIAPKLFSLRKTLSLIVIGLTCVVALVKFTLGMVYIPEYKKLKRILKNW